MIRKHLLLNQLSIFAFILLAKMLYTRHIIFGRLELFSIIFDIASVLIILLFIELIINKRKFFIFLLVDIITSVLLLATVIYFSYFGAIITYSDLSQLHMLNEIGGSILSLLQIKFLLLLIDIPLMVILRVANESIFLDYPILKKKNSVAMLAILLIITSWNMVLEEEQTINELKKAENLGLLCYEALCYANSIKQSNSDYSKTITMNTVKEISEDSTSEQIKYFGVAQNKNILVVQLEAFENFPIDLEVNGIEITAVLNKLKGESIYFPNFYQQIGKGSTADAEFMLNTSLYPLRNIAMSEHFGTTAIPSLPRILHELGYQTLTFHSNDIEFWNRDEMYPSLGFNQYFDKSYFGKKDVIAYGASDEILYEKSLLKMLELKKQGKLFYANLISMSSHHPFKLPPGKETIDLPDKLRETSVGDYLSAVNYADKALGQLIDGLKEYGLWEDTLFIVYGDHFGLQLPTKNDQLLIDEILGRKYDGRLDKLNVPLLIRIPGHNKMEIYEKVGGQVDLMPTIANLTGITLNEYVYFGRDLLNNKNHLLPVRFYLPAGSFFNNEVLFVPGEGFDDGVAKLISNHKTTSKGKI